MIKDRIILGIDPGTIVMGYGILKIEGNNRSWKLWESCN